MDLTPHVEELRHQLVLAAESGGGEARALAERLIAPLESATRLVLLDALTAAANEITRDLAPGSVDVRLRGRDPEFVVTAPSFEAPDDGVAAAAGPPGDGDDGGTARISLRLPEQLKARLEGAAGRDGLSLNSWLVRAVAAAVDPHDRSQRRGPAGGQRFTGWAR